MTTLFYSLILLLASCSEYGSQTNNGDSQIADSEHHVFLSTGNINHDSTYLNTGWYYIIDSKKGIKRQLEKSTDTYFIDKHAILTANNFTTLEIYESNAGGTTYVGMTIRLDESGTEKWSIATKNSIGKQLAFILDNRLIQIAKVNAQITSGVTALNSGNYSRAELEKFKSIIESER